MRWKVPAGVLMALAFLIPAAPAVAQTASPGLNDACQTVERKVYTDLRKLVTIDLDTATDVQVRVLTAQILSAANAASFVVLPPAIQKHLDGTPEDLRAFLKTDLQQAWTTDLRVRVTQTLTKAGVNVKAAAQTTLDDGSIDVLLAYLNDGLYAARALDCKAQPTPTPSASSSATPSASPSATATAAPAPSVSSGAAAPGGEGGGLPVTGAATATVVGIGGALLLLGGAIYLIGRRRRTHFAA
ncbi:LPXTG cell wall anchor domain-containing protein [Micromonospora chokoriensis]|uniref:LPXTG cell wall anchor domain-containing protein n=1 Tax=Micromonospora chokoriensis TaxID=356851 RepID=UPI0004C30178|nr:LPXTG cell wall anchor domain-containing protein [Micromonospora chokoriensis]